MPQKKKINVNAKFTISYTIVRGRHTNFPDVEHHLMDSKLDFLFLFYKLFDNSVTLQELAISDYLALTNKQDSRKRHGHGHGHGNIKDRFHCGRGKINDDPDLRYMCFCLQLSSVQSLFSP